MQHITDTEIIENFEIYIINTIGEEAIVFNDNRDNILYHLEYFIYVRMKDYYINPKHCLKLLCEKVNIKELFIEEE